MRKNNYGFYSLVLVVLLSAFNKPCFSTAMFTPGIAVPIAVDGGETGGGLNFGVLFQTEPNSRLYAGADLGLHFWGKVHGLTESTTALQLLPSAIYKLSAKPNWVPFIGLSAGPYWYVAQADGFPGIDFLLLFRPGLIIQIGQSLGLVVEAKYGSVGGAFLFMPSVGANFNF